MFSVQQLIQLLSGTNNIVFHLVTLLSLQAVLGIALAQRRRRPEDSFALRLVLASAILLVLRLGLMGLIIVTAESEAQARRFLPPFEQFSNTVTVLLLIWALLRPPDWLDRLGNVLTWFALPFLFVMYVFFAQQWAAEIRLDLSYSATTQALIWSIVQATLLAIGVLATLLTGRGRPDWPLRFSILATLLVTHVVQLARTPLASLTGSDVPHWVRLGQLAALPLAAIVAYRHALATADAALDEQETRRDRTVDSLRLNTQVIRYPDINRALPEALNLVRELLPAAGFAAVGVLQLDSSDELRVVSRLAEGDGLKLQNWMLNLIDWPSLRLALKQRSRVELVRNGLGARQLSDLYEELNLTGLGPMLIEPLMQADEEVGLLMLAGPQHMERWPPEVTALSGAVAQYLGQVIYNAHEHERRLRSASSITPGGGERGAIGRLYLVEKERDEALAEARSMAEKLQRAEARAAAEEEHANQLAAALAEAQENKGQSPAGAVAGATPGPDWQREQLEHMQAELETLRESLLQAEEALAIAAAGDRGLSADWVMRAITRYSGELEMTQARLSELEYQLARRDEVTVPADVFEQLDALRAPMTAIAGYTEVMLSEALGILGVNQREFMERVQENVARMRQILDRVYALGQPRDTSEPEVDQVDDVRRVIEAAVDTVVNQLRTRRLRLNLNIAPSLPPASLSEQVLFKIVAHLLNNACHVARPDSQIALTAGCAAIQEPANGGNGDPFRFLQLDVTDQSDGLSPELVPLVFSGQPPDTLPFTAGLALAHALSTAHGGRMWLESRQGQGNTFSVLLPLSARGLASGANNHSTNGAGPAGQTPDRPA